MAQTEAVSRQPLFLTDSDVRSSFDWREAGEALRTAYAADITPSMSPPRTMARQPGFWLRTLSGIAADRELAGAKLITFNKDPRSASYLISLLDQRSTELVALLDGNSVTAFRTAATSALAAHTLARTGTSRVAVIGSGFEARNHVRALQAMRQIDGVAVFSPNPASRIAFIDHLGDTGIALRDAESAPSALEGADIVICAARARNETPTLRGEWLRPGMTVVSIGSTLPEQREVDAEVIRRAEVIVADMVEEVAHETGDMIEASHAGVDWQERLVSLADLIAGRVPGRTRDDEIILYKSVGAAIQDLTVAALCVERARELGLGTWLPVSINPVKKGQK